MSLARSLHKGIQDHREKIGKPHFIFSAEAPKYPDMNTVKMNHEQVLGHLKGAGYDAHAVQGHYGGPERSIVVYGVTPNVASKLHGLAARLGQDSSIYSTGQQHEMLFHHGADKGKKVTGEGTVWHPQKPADFYTSLPGGQHHFTHNFNFDTQPDNSAAHAPEKKVVNKSEDSSGKICTPAKEMVEEHKHLVKVLKSPSRKDDKKEAVKQAKELEEYKQYVKCEQTSWTFINIRKAEDPEAYKKLAMKGMMIGFPATINGRHARPDNGMHYHSTVKLFNPEKDSPEEAHAIASQLGMKAPDPEHIQIKPEVFKDRLGNDVYVMRMHGPHADQIKGHNKAFEHMGYKTNYEFTPHISMDRATWQSIVDSKAKTAKEAGIEFHPAELKQGTKTVQTYRHNVIPMPAKEPKKLAASEDVANDLSKSIGKKLGAAAAVGAMAATASPAAIAPTDVSHQPAQLQHAHGYSTAKMLNAIEQVESSGGKDTNHHVLGSPLHHGERAFGKYGLTPVIIRETVKMNPDLKSKYSKVMALKGDSINKFMQDNPDLEDIVAHRHVKRLEHHFGSDPQKIGYAWLNGITGTYGAGKNKEDISKHWHVKKVMNAFNGGK